MALKQACHLRKEGFPRGKKAVENSLITSTEACWVISASWGAWCRSSLHWVWAITSKCCVTWLAQMTRELLALHFTAPIKIILMLWHSRATCPFFKGTTLPLSTGANIYVIYFIINYLFILLLYSIFFFLEVNILNLSKILRMSNYFILLFCSHRKFFVLCRLKKIIIMLYMHVMCCILLLQWKNLIVCSV